jgi:hypothetical protein
MGNAVDGEVDDEDRTSEDKGARGGQGEVVKWAARRGVHLIVVSGDPRETEVLADTDAARGHNEAAETECIGSESANIHPVRHVKFLEAKAPDQKDTE